VLRPKGFLAGITSNGDCPWYRIRTQLEGEARHACTGHFVTPESLTAHSGARACLGQDQGLGAPCGRACRSASHRAEGVVAPTPLARYLGVLSFRARKADRGNEVDFGKPDAHFRRP